MQIQETTLPKTTNQKKEKNTDTIYIRDLLIRSIIGIYDWERKDKQDLIINATLKVNISKAAKSDDINDAVNYRNICKRLITLAENNTAFLLEKLVEEMANMVLNEFEVEYIKICIDKPGALRFSKSVAIEIERFKENQNTH